ncbi:hypothetical protein WJX81_004397 [Elliptochloris bilobata]|uniref:Ethanolaminephosphotransferase n=1 Tax=Elliptochloris bilobata TaxID=381761 RepID=A0AAW1SC86_9CHLO
MPVLSKRALEGLRTYQYKPAGYTVLDDWHQPFWNWCTELLPRWLAPNLITLTGVFGLTVAYLVSWAYLPSMEGDAPRWVYAGCGLACLAYLHLDCLDGKQARRTSSSSPLGQLFDHGCDALAVHLVVTMLAASISGGFSWQTVAGHMAIMGPWVAAHWEEYHTGVMLYGNGYWGVTEANYLMVAVHLFTAAVGPGFWRWRVADMLHTKAAPWPLRADAHIFDVVLVVISGFAVQQIAGQVWRVFFTRISERMPAAERGHKQLGRPAAARHLSQLLAVLGLCSIALLEACSGGVSQARATLVTAGLAYAVQATKLIMDHMAKEPFEALGWPLALLALNIVCRRAAIPWLAAYVWGVAAIMLVGYLHYITNVIGEICAFLGIACLTIKQAPS